MKEGRLDSIGPVIQNNTSINYRKGNQKLHDRKRVMVRFYNIYDDLRIFHCYKRYQMGRRYMKLKSIFNWSCRNLYRLQYLR